MTIAALGLFGGSKTGSDPAVAELAAGIGALAAARGLTLVCDAGEGLARLAARAALTDGGRVVGIVSATTPFGATEHVVADGDDRTAAIVARSDAVVVLPGGIGTMAAVFAVMTGRDAGRHAVPVLLVDRDGGRFWQPCRDLLGHLDRAGFAEPGLFDLIEPLAGLDALAARLARFE